MSASFVFYDLETSGISPKSARIMQFAGQRTDMNLKAVGDPFNYLIKLTDEILPDPEAILITGITPQKTLQDGITEAEFLKIFVSDIATPDTIFCGFNSIRFDDEFMRYTMYRNLYDPYEWQWQQGKSKWDLLDVVRMTRALRPDGFNWPIDSDGKPTNRLELLTSQNGLEHTSAHDALSDVQATIEIAKLIRQKQPRLFDFLLTNRTKEAVAKIVNSQLPFVYTSGKYQNEFQKTTVVGKVADYINQGALVFDLRYDPTEYSKLSVDQLRDLLIYDKDRVERLPVKPIKFNRCPAIAPVSVLDEDCHKRLGLNPKEYLKNYKTLNDVKSELTPKLIKAFELLDEGRKEKFAKSIPFVDEQLYDGFFNSVNKESMSAVRNNLEKGISGNLPSNLESRVKRLLPLYKARNYPALLNDEERIEWEEFRTKFLLEGGNKSRAAVYFEKLQNLISSPKVTQQQSYLLTELMLYGQAIMPESN